MHWLLSGMEDTNVVRFFLSCHSNLKRNNAYEPYFGHVATKSSFLIYIRIHEMEWAQFNMRLK
jgi:hypothetical protein